MTSWQQDWAENKYWVMAHSQQHYNQIRQLAKNNDWTVDKTTEFNRLLAEAGQQVPTVKTLTTAYQHIWGYFKKQASLDERKDYMLLLDRYRFGQASKEDLIARTRDLLERYPNAYLQHSTLLKGDSHETLA